MASLGRQDARCWCWRCHSLPALRWSEPTLQPEIRYCTTSDDVRLAVVSDGSGIPVVRTGTWLTHIEFKAVEPLGQASVEAFSHGARYVFYDSRGRGLSQREVNDVSLDAWVRDLETVADALGLDRFVVYGQSIGCGIALRYARLHPVRVDRLILHSGYVRHAYCSTDPIGCRLGQDARARPLWRMAALDWPSRNGGCTLTPVIGGTNF